MALADRIRVATATTGTGNLTLSATGVRDATNGDCLAPAEVASRLGGQTIPYFIQNGARWASGKGSLSADGLTLTRAANEQAWDGSAYSTTGKLSLVGSSTMFVTPRSEDLQGYVEVYTPAFLLMGGAVSNSPAIQAKIDEAHAAGGGIVQLPAGIIGIGTPLVPKPNVVLRGAGMDATILYLTTDVRLLTQHALARSGYGGVEDLTLSGYADRTATLGGDSNRNADIGPFDRAWYRRVRCINSRQMGLTGNAGSFWVEDCVLNKIHRDGINLTGSTHMFVANNLIEEVGDDAIALHTSAGVSGINDTSIHVIGNTVRKSFGIKCLGARNTTIVGNSLRFLWGYGFYLGPDSTEGNITQRGVVIDGNTVMDLLNGSLTGVNGFTEYFVYMAGERTLGSGGTAITTLPGNYNAATQKFQLPSPFDNMHGSAYARSSNSNIVITNNTFAQTLDRKPDNSGQIATFADAGFGNMWGSSGSINPALTTLMFTGIGVALYYGDYEGLNINGNSFYGVGTAVRYLQGGSGTILRSVAARGNNIFRCKKGFELVANGAVFDVGVVISENSINLDPYHESSLRVTPLNGEWTGLGGSDWSAISAEYCRGIVFEDNSIRHCGIAVRSVLGAVVSARDNKLYWDWSGTAKGIGDVGNVPPPENHHFFQFSNPTLSSYGQHSATADSSFVSAAAAMPSSGYYRQGQVVYASSVTVSGGTVLDGWERVTSGNAHVLGTDWVERRLRTSTDLVTNANLGFSTGAGGTSTQPTSKTTAAPALNRQTGEVTMSNAALAAAATVSFTMANSTAAVGDMVVATHHSGGTIGAYTIVGRVTAAGTITFTVRNNTAGSLSEAIVIKFAVVKAVTA